jgi:peptidoglycan/LPS O-acetylase OafA/YrhL
MKKDVTLSLYRVIATLFILLCHIGTHYDSGLVSMGFLVGVEMFLLLSGYLVAKGAAKVRDLRFLAGRYFRIMLPVWIFALIYLIAALCTQSYGVLDLLPYFLGISGLPRLHCGSYFTGVQGLTHLWYITAALLCELLAVPLLALKRRIGMQTRRCRLLTAAVIAALYLLLWLTPLRLDYFLVFATGLFFYDELQRPVGGKGLLLALGALGVAFAARLVAMRLIDGTAFYTRTVIPLTYVVIAVAALVALRALCNGRLTALAARVAGNPAVAFLERCSFEIYISHYVFIVGPLCVYALALPEIVKNLLFIVCSLAAAFLLHVLVRAVNRWCKR